MATRDTFKCAVWSSKVDIFKDAEGWQWEWVWPSNCSYGLHPFTGHLYDLTCRQTFDAHSLWSIDNTKLAALQTHCWPSIPCTSHSKVRIYDAKNAKLGTVMLYCSIFFACHQCTYMNINSTVKTPAHAYHKNCHKCTTNALVKLIFQYIHNLYIHRTFSGPTANFKTYQIPN